MDKVGELLKAHGLSYDDVFRCAVTVVDSVDPARMKVFNEIYVSYFKRGRYPARSLLSPANLPLKADLTVECWAHVPTK
jgi:enamine deaminase RidA (YjgF/YER057c/UK114 family)